MILTCPKCGHQKFTVHRTLFGAKGVYGVIEVLCDKCSSAVNYTDPKVYLSP